MLKTFSTHIVHSLSHLPPAADTSGTVQSIVVDHTNLINIQERSVIRGGTEVVPTRPLDFDLSVEKPSVIGTRCLPNGVMEFVIVAELNVLDPGLPQVVHVVWVDIVHPPAVARTAIGPHQPLGGALALWQNFLVTPQVLGETTSVGTVVSGGLINTTVVLEAHHLRGVPALIQVFGTTVSPCSVKSVI